MKLRLHFFDDNFIDLDEIKESLRRIPEAQQLREGGIDVGVERVEQIGNYDRIRDQAIASYRRSLDAVSSLKEGGNIMFVDLRLYNWGLTLDDQLAIYNETVPDGLRLSPSADHLMKETCGGFALAWSATLSGGARNLIVFASSAASRRLVESRFQSLIAEAQRLKPVLIQHYIQDESFSVGDAALREGDLGNAIRKWVEFFWSARARIHPAGSETWFDSSPTMPHAIPTGTHREYQKQLIDYLATCLRTTRNIVETGYFALAPGRKANLHTLLKAVVGDCAASHKGRGERLQWRHLPFLAAACAPAPAAWIFTNDFPWACTYQVVPGPNTSSLDRDLIDHLVGDETGAREGAFTLLLKDKHDPQTSRLETLHVQNGRCEIKVTYSTVGLKANFNEGNALRPQHDCSGALWDLHQFLSSFGGGIEVTDDNRVIISCPKS